MNDSSFVIVSIVSLGTTGAIGRQGNQYFLAFPMNFTTKPTSVRFQGEVGALGSAKFIGARQWRIQKRVAPILYAFVDQGQHVLHKPLWARVDIDEMQNMVVELLGVAKSANDLPATEHGIEFVVGTPWNGEDRDIRLAKRPIETAYEAFQAFQEATTMEGPSEGRSRVWTEILVRRGQAQFRSALLQVFGQRCFLTGCEVRDVLEAAHVMPYSTGGASAVENGLLLRADLHLLFDTGLLAIDVRNSSNLRVVFHPKVEGAESYEELRTKPLLPPRGMNLIQQKSWLLNLSRHFAWTGLSSPD